MKRAVYRKTEVKAGQTILVSYTYPTKFGEELTRRKRSEGTGTPADMEEYNKILAIRKLTAILNENFTTDDIFLTLHYEKENRPEDEETAKYQLKVFLKKLKLLYENKGLKFFYVKTTAIGERGGLHHHVIIPKGAEQREVTKLWKEVIKASHKARPPEFRALYDTNEYSSLAAYFCQQGEKSGKEKVKNARKWVCSRNIKRPVPQQSEDVYEIKWKEPPTPKRGYYIDTDSICAGCNPITGKPYLFYQMIKLKSNFTCYDSGGRRLYGAEAVRYYRRTNKEYIKQNWFKLNSEGEVVFKLKVEYV